jgi:regulator of RNase E activity RraA
MDFDQLQDFVARYKRLYVPAVADALDKRGLWNQLLANDIKPLTMDAKIAGPAFTAKGHPTTLLDVGIGSRILEHFTPLCVAMWDTSSDTTVGHWGELMSNAAQSKGCQGAVIDGGVRDTSYILARGFPVFTRFRCAADAMGRWKITDMNIPVRMSGVLVRPGDWVFGDVDGVVIVPEELIVEVLEEAEAVVEAENKIREAVKSGAPLHEMYDQFKLTDRSATAMGIRK